MKTKKLLSLIPLALFCLMGNVCWGVVNNTTVTKTGSSQKFINVSATAASSGDEVTVSNQYIAYTVNELVANTIKGVWYTQGSGNTGSSDASAISITGYRTANNKYTPISSSKSHTFYITNCISFSVIYDPRSGGRYITITATNVDDGTDVLTQGNSGTVASGTYYNVSLSGLDKTKYYRVVVVTNNGSDSRLGQIRLEAPHIDPSIEFRNGSYNVGDAALDLRDLFSSNSSGAVTYTITGDNNIGASIDGYSFTATTAGNVTVKALQAQAGAYNSKEVSATINVTSLTSPTFTVTPSADYLIGDDLTLNTLISENNSDGLVSYSIKSDGGTEASIDEGVFTATSEGTAIVTISVAETASFAAASRNVTITVTHNPLGTNTITYILTAASANVSGSSTSSYISSFSTAFSVSNLSIGTTSQTGYSGDITGSTEGATEYETTKYVDLVFVVANGYAFIPTEVSFSVNPFGNTGAMKYVLAFIDNNNTILSDEILCSKNTNNAVTFAADAFDKKALGGTIHVRAYFYGAKSDKKVYIKSPITITGNVIESVAVSTLSDRNYATMVTPAGKKLDFANAEGVKAYIATGFNGAKTAIVLKEISVAPANTPIIVWTETQGATVNVPVTANNPSSADETTLALSNLVAGDGSTAWDGTAGYTYYYLASDQFHKATSGTLQSGKAYLKVANGDVPATAPSLFFVFDEENNATDIQSIESADKAIKFFEDGKLLIMRDGVVYDALGRIIR